MAYSQSYFSARESWRDWRIEAHELIEWAKVTVDTRVLEIGCGGGGLLQMLGKRNAIAVGVDTLETALNLAHERDQSGLGKPDRSLLTRIGEEGALPFRSAYFDAVIGQHVVEHLPDTHAALAEWKRVLKPGGRLAIATPNASYPDPAHFADSDHEHLFAPRDLQHAVERAGFVVVHCSTIFPFLSRLGIFRATGVIAYRVFQHAPYFSADAENYSPLCTKTLNHVRESQRGDQPAT